MTGSQTSLNVSKGEAKPARVDTHVNRVPEGKAKSLPAHGKEWILGVSTEKDSPLLPLAFLLLT